MTKLSLGGDAVVEFRASDNFINATQLCKAGGKNFKDWYRLESTRKLIEELPHLLVDMIKVGPNNMRGTWIHPRLAIHLAQWISPNFAIKVSGWVEQWYNTSANNYNEFIEELSNLEPSETNQIEKKIQSVLREQYKAEIEVKTPVGYVDLLSAKYIIEIKEASKWKHALGQILIYGSYYPAHKKVIVLFGELTVDKSINARLYGDHGVALKICSQNKGCETIETEI